MRSRVVYNAVVTDHEQAIAFLRRELKTAAPSRIKRVAAFAGAPLEGEGAMTVFSFTADIGESGVASYYVVAGETEANYYPAWDLSPEEIYRVHLGTRFMLVLSVAQRPANELSDELDPAARAFLESVAPQANIHDVAVRAAFQVDDQRHVVYRLRIDGETVYVFGGDGPPGACRLIDLLPHVAYRLHLGNVILSEAERDRRAEGA